MCKFCTQHGDGKKWYLRAENYSADLQSDLHRRRMMLGFVDGFGRTVSRGFAGLEALKRLPGPLRRMISSVAERRQQAEHYGQPVPIEDCALIFDIATSIVLLPCICREHSGGPERACCLAISVSPPDDELTGMMFGTLAGPDTDGLQRLSKEEALALMRQWEHEGLLHSVWTFVTPFIGAICNCSDPSGCLAMRAIRRYDFRMMWKGEYVATVDPDLCVGCGKCLGLCPFEAIEMGRADRKARVRWERCYGCGICRAQCPTQGITLSPRAGHPETANLW